MVVDQSLSCFIRDNNTGEVFAFNIEKPEGYSDSYSPNFQQQDVRGRSSPFQSYVNSGPRQVQFSVLLSLDYRRDLAEQTAKVRSMMKPYNKGTGMAIRPPSVHVRIGNAVEMDAIPTSFSAEWSEGYKEGVFRICTWSFGFTEVEIEGTYNKDTVLGTGYIKAEIPSGMNYIASNVSEKLNYNVGETIEVQDTVTVYNTSNDANNRVAENSKQMSPGDYVVTDQKGDALEISTSFASPGDIGWMPK